MVGIGRFWERNDRYWTITLTDTIKYPTTYVMSYSHNLQCLYRLAPTNIQPHQLLKLTYFRLSNNKFRTSRITCHPNLAHLSSSNNPGIHLIIDLSHPLLGHAILRSMSSPTRQAHLPTLKSDHTPLSFEPHLTLLLSAARFSHWRDAINVSWWNIFSSSQ